MCPGVELEGWLRWFAHPFVVLSAGGLAQYSPFAPGSSEAEGGLYVFVSFWSRICLNLTCAVILSHIVSLYLLSLGEVCSSARFLTLKQRVPDLKPVSLPYSPPGYFIIMY